MVRLALVLALIAAPAFADLSPTADAVAPLAGPQAGPGTAQAGLNPAAQPALAPAPVPLSTTAELGNFHPEPNHPVEDFFTVSIISLPFTAIWSFVGATAVAAVAQQKFPPEYTDQLFITAGAAAAGLSFGIGLVSVSWGPGKAKAPPAQP